MFSTQKAKLESAGFIADQNVLSKFSPFFVVIFDNFRDANFFRNWLKLPEKEEKEKLVL